MLIKNMNISFQKNYYLSFGKIFSKNQRCINLGYLEYNKKYNSKKKANFYCWKWV